MKRLSFIFTLLIFSGIIFSFYSCEKENLALNTNIEDELFPENSEMIIDGELFIDGVSQKEVITDFDIDGVEVIDGRLAFVDHDAMMNAIHKLAKYNTESVVAWSEKIGFTSLFTELTRIEELLPIKIKEELDRGDMYNEYFYITEEGELNLKKYTTLYARIFSTHGILQVGKYVGTISPGLNIWVEASNVEKLINALKTHIITEKDTDFFIVDKSAFNNNKDWVHTVTCPKDGTWEGPWNKYKNPNARRRIDVRNSYYEFISYAGNNLWNASNEYLLETVSKKASWNKYKTNHYLSLNIRTRLMSSFGGGPIIASQKTDNDNNTKYGYINLAFSTFRNVSLNFINSNWLRLHETVAGSSGQTGTAGSHRGMGGRYGRQDCS